MHRIVMLLEEVMGLLPEGVSLAKGGVGEIALAHHLGHTLVAGDKGADAIGSDGLLYEYKVSTTDQFNFHFGARGVGFGKVEKHFAGVEGAYCAKRVGMKIVEVVYVPSSVLVPALLEHFSGTKGGQLNKNYRLKSFSALNNS